MEPLPEELVPLLRVLLEPLFTRLPLELLLPVRPLEELELLLELLTRVLPELLLPVRPLEELELLLEPLLTRLLPLLPVRPLLLVPVLPEFVVPLLTRPLLLPVLPVLPLLEPLSLLMRPLLEPLLTGAGGLFPLLWPELMLPALALGLTVALGASPWLSFEAGGGVLPL